MLKNTEKAIDSDATPHFSNCSQSSDPQRVFGRCLQLYEIHTLCERICKSVIPTGEREGHAINVTESSEVRFAQVIK